MAYNDHWQILAGFLLTATNPLSGLNLFSLFNTSSDTSSKSRIAALVHLWNVECHFNSAHTNAWTIVQSTTAPKATEEASEAFFSNLLPKVICNLRKIMQKFKISSIFPSCLYILNSKIHTTLSRPAFICLNSLMETL